MPTTLYRNILYRAALPVLAPRCGKSPVTEITGHPVHSRHAFTHIIRKHHVLGSATCLFSQNQKTIILTSSESPAHNAYPDTCFRVASITKTITAAAALKLSDAGILDLNKPASEYFTSGNEKTVLKDITLRHLLSHTSGIIDPPNLEYDVENRIPFPSVLQSARHFQPGTSFHYSNLGFGLIGCVFEQILGLPVSSIFDRYIFEPLKMNATLEGCRIPREKIMPVTRVLPYRKGKDVTVTTLGCVRLCGPDPLYHYGHTAGSLYTDIGSLFLFFHMLSSNDNHFISASSVNDMKTEHASYGRLSPTLTYGLGLLRINDPYVSDHTVYGHQGFAYGCVDGAFWDDATGDLLIFLNGGCSEARRGRLGCANRDMLHWAFRKELPAWSE